MCDIIHYLNKIFSTPTMCKWGIPATCEVDVSQQRESTAVLLYILLLSIWYLGISMPVFLTLLLCRWVSVAREIEHAPPTYLVWRSLQS